MQTLVVKHDRNTHATIFDEETLNGVGRLGRFPWVCAWTEVAPPANLPQPMPMPEVLRGALCIEPPLLVEQSLFLTTPDAHHLGRFVFEVHPREQISPTRSEIERSGSR